MPRIKTLQGHTTEIQTGCGPVYITINGDPPVEVLITIGKAGGRAMAQTDALGRMITVALRHGATVEDILRHLSGIACHSPAGVGEERVLSCADAVAKALNIKYEDIKGGKPN